MRTTRAVALAAVVSATLIGTAGCGLVDQDTRSAPKPPPTPTTPFTKEAVANEVGAAADASGLPPGDDSTAGMPEGEWQSCVAPWMADAPEADAADAFAATVKTLRKQGWKLTTSRAEQDVTFRTLTKRGWKVYARHYAMDGFGAEQPVSLTAVKDGCELPEEIKGDFQDTL
ncbi:hypothetical protein [Streptomyces sp. BE147]|uniref:hypothetical protein n=1 Tax=unclassified Streptomyces TaxID=2593676 RepID=UPI002E7A1118|nr:hypothetical protein [Streptomyces sp. BE147]MEE1738531.1 hypothetical protein [Streptomyces sp. BE147]